MTENHQVSVRILTELPAVRDMIEAGIQQLKSELQSQGLHVDRLEVSVSDDLRRHPEHQARQGARLWKEAAEGASSADRRMTDERLEPIYYRPRPGAAGAIDMFA
jgi:flagellar hook-length control protein FliK